MFILLDKIYTSEGNVGYVFLNIETQRLYYHSKEKDPYTPRMITKDLPDWMIEAALTGERKLRNKAYLQELARGEDDWSLRDQQWVKIKPVTKYDCIKNEHVKLKEIHFTRPQGVSAYRNCVPSWEDNIQFVTRHGIDNGMPMGMLWDDLTKGEFTPPTHYDDPKIHDYLISRGFNESVIEHFIPLMITPIPHIERVAIDIETRYDATLKPNAEHAAFPIISIVIKSNKEFDPITVFALKEDRRKRGEPNEELKGQIKRGEVIIREFETERKLLQTFFIFMRTQPQILLTYNGDDFDLPYLKNRALRLGIDLKQIPIHVATKKKKEGTTKGFTDGIARWRGKIHVDIYKTFSNTSIKNYTYGGKYQQNTLDEVAYALLGKRKIDIGDMNLATFYELIYYNIIDTILTLELTTYQDDLFMNLLISLMRLTNSTLPDINRFAMSAWTHNMLFTYLIKNEILVPNKKQLDKVYTSGQEIESIIEGAEYRGGELEIRKGYFFNVIGLDYTGLYPSVTDRYNICFSTLNCAHDKCRENTVPETEYWICEQERGLLPDVFGVIKDVRAKFFKPKGKQGDATAYAMEQTQKVLVNGAIGVFGNRGAKLYCPAISGSVTAYSRQAIKIAEEVSHNYGLVCVYMHTDSTYLIHPSSKRISEEQTDQLMKEISDALKLGMEIDNRFQFMIVHQKANYLGVKEEIGLHEGEDRFVIKGLMGKKRNVPNIVKDTFSEVKEALLPIKDESTLNQQRKTIIDIIRRKIDYISKCKGKIEDYTYKLTLTKKPSKYTKTTPQHLKAGKMLADYKKRTEGIKGDYDRILPAGSIIHFVKTRKKCRVEPSIIANVKNIDVDEYIKTLKSTLKQLLENIHIDDLDLQGLQQTDISTFFTSG